jgi:hypothetical protein
LEHGRRTRRFGISSATPTDDGKSGVPPRVPMSCLSDPPGLVAHPGRWRNRITRGRQFQASEACRLPQNAEGRGTRSRTAPLSAWPRPRGDQTSAGLASCSPPARGSQRTERWRYQLLPRGGVGAPGDETSRLIVAVATPVLVILEVRIASFSPAANRVYSPAQVRVAVLGCPRDRARIGYGCPARS